MNTNAMTHLDSPATVSATTYKIQWRVESGTANLNQANSDPDTGSSQFFITLAPASQLDNKHAVFGKLIKGEDVLLAIGSVEVDENDRPLTEVAMVVNIIENNEAID